MTATTIPQDLATRSWNSLLRMAAAVAVLIVLALGSFAVGRTTADSSAQPAVQTASHVASPANADSCGHVAHTPPC